MSATERYDIVVVGGGHAGIEACSAGARLGHRTLLVTMDKNAIGRLSCNPAIGGMAKGQLVCEIDALGGEMGQLADQSGIQFKVLGMSKGPAMWSPRSQNDKDLYPLLARQRLEQIDGLDIIEGLVDDVLLKDGSVAGVRMEDGRRFGCKAVVVCSGTFLSSRMHTGETIAIGGRVNELSAENLSDSLRRNGVRTGRLKTGTPPRVHRETIDYSKCRADGGDEHPVPFSGRTVSVYNKIQCYVTGTTPETHNVLRSGFDRSPMYTGRITGTGPRYCPSIEDKISRFEDKDTHQIFLEPEGLQTDSVYVNGFSTSLPEDIQIAALQTVPGLERVRLLRLGYAVEYDYFPSVQLKLSLESKVIPGLFFAGQVNGTSGYEEAAAQGLLAGINAARTLQGTDPLILSRSQAYIGVLIDDLANLTISEPYRMFTSRAEHRLLLRRDNADFRLSSIGYAAGLVSHQEHSRVQTLSVQTDTALELLKAVNVTIPDNGDSRVNAWQFLRRPGSTVDQVITALPQDHPLSPLLAIPRVKEQVWISAKYDGYVQKQRIEVDRIQQQEDAVIPDSIDYHRIKSLSSEAREKLSAIRPRSIGQAGRISGVSRSDLSILMLFIR